MTRSLVELSYSKNLLFLLGFRDLDELSGKILNTQAVPE
jgi:hypothetical protein